VVHDDDRYIDVATGRELDLFVADDDPSHVRSAHPYLGEDGQHRLAVLDHDRVRTWNLATHRIESDHHFPEFTDRRRPEYMPQPDEHGRLLLDWLGATPVLLALRGVPRALDIPRDPDDRIMFYAFTPDTTRLVTMTMTSHEMAVWDTATGLLLEDAAFDTDLRSSTWEFQQLGDRFQLAVADGGDILLWTGDGPISRLTSAADYITDIALGPRGTLVAGASYDSVRVWTADTARQIAAFPRDEGTFGLGSLDFSADESRLQLPSRAEIQVWRLDREDRPPAEISALAATTPWTVADGRLVHRAP
jgi:WD40 repeat protein